MSVRFEADGDRWQVALEAHAPPGRGAVVFHCVSNPQRPYRVVPVPSGMSAAGGEFGEGVPEESLRELFARSQIMDFTLDADADPRRDERRTEP